MKNFFRMESPLMTFLGRITDFLVLSILWLLCCIPVVTVIPATAALYYVMLKIVRKEDTGVVKDFLHSFRSNLKQGTILSFVFLLISVLLLADLQIIIVAQGIAGTVVKVIFSVLSVFFVTVAIYTVALQAQFVNTIRQTLKNAVLMSVRYTLNSIVVLLLNALPALVAVFALKAFLGTLLFWIFLAPAIIAYVCARCFRRIFDPLIEKLADVER